MPTVSVETLPLETEPSLASTAELLVAPDELLLTTVGSQASAAHFSLLFATADHIDERNLILMSLSLTSFLRERAARPAERHLASILRRAIADGGHDLCERLRVCEKLGQLDKAVARFAEATGGALGVDEIREHWDEIEEFVRERFGEEALEALQIILGLLAETSQLLGDAAAQAAELVADFALPILPMSLVWFILRFSLEDLCQCDRKPEERAWPH